MHRRSGLKIVMGLIGLVTPMLPIMMIAIFMGVIGYLTSIFLTIIGAKALLEIVLYQNSHLNVYFIVLIVCGVFRGVLRYIEQASNHYIAFKLLAVIRDQVFTKLRQLAPAKLEGKEKGNLISMITSDVELLEVFYAHTISPVMIALFVSLIMSTIMFSYHYILGIISIIAYITVGIILPIITSKQGKETGLKQRNLFGTLNSYVLESIQGIKEVIQYNQGNNRIENIIQQSQELNQEQHRLKYYEGMSMALTHTVISFFSMLVFFISIALYGHREVTLSTVLMSTVVMMSSFGPVTALSSLANNLLITFASGERILSLLEETPEIYENTTGIDENIETFEFNNVEFGYQDETILKDINLQFKPNKIIGIKGKSGTGKSTLLKLMMRFYDVTKGEVLINSKNIKNFSTSSLRRQQSYVTQDSYLFDDTIYNNLKIANLNASKQQIIEACQKANIHDFILTLKDGYDSYVGELGDQLSGGQRQRIGIARGFLHNSKMILLDEPTSNLDSLSEAVILKSIVEHKQDKTIILVTHRESTLKIADEIIDLESDRLS